MKLKTNLNMKHTYSHHGKGTVHKSNRKIERGDKRAGKKTRYTFQFKKIQCLFVFYFF